MGETTSDYLVHKVDPAIAVAFAGIGLIISLILQFSMRQYVAWAYWLVVVMVSIFGTMAADALHVGLGVPYVVSTVFFIVVLTATFVIWYAKEKTLSIHSITSRRRELFYWTTVLATFALGTAAGDMTAVTLHQGYFMAGITFAFLIAIPAVAYWRFKLNPILSFWFAYIITRPLGASFADWLGVPASRGGLGLGTGRVSLGLTILIIGFVSYLAFTRSDIKKKQIIS